MYNNTLDLDNSALLSAHFKHHDDQYYKLDGLLKDNKIEGSVETPTQPKRLIFNGDFTKVNDNLYQISGELTNVETSEVFQLISPIKVENGGLSSIDVTVTPKNLINSEDQIPIKLRLKKERYGLFFEAESKQIKSSVKMNLINSYNWDLRAKMIKEDDQIYSFVTFMNVQVNGNTTLYLEAQTPWEQMEKLVFDGNLLLDTATGNVRVKHQLNQDSGHVLFLWRLFYLSDMFANVAAGYQHDDVSVKDLNAMVFFVNPKKAFKNIETGFDINVDQDKWRFATNLTVGLHNQNNVDAVLKVRLPPPNSDTHSLLLSYHTNSEHTDMSYVVGYNAIVAKSNYASDGSVSLHLF